MPIDQKVLEQVSRELQAYVYMLVDPMTGVPFYVGKGQGVRHAAHSRSALEPVDEAGEQSRKHARIRELTAAGHEPETWILRYGLNASEYTAVEAAAIDLLMTFPVTVSRPGQARRPLTDRSQLTNMRREDARTHGMTLLQSLVEEYAAQPLVTQEPLLIITLNAWNDDAVGEQIAGGQRRDGAGYKREWLVSTERMKAYEEIGVSVSAWWSISTRVVETRRIHHVVAVHRGVTRALFQIKSGSWETITIPRKAKNGRTITKSAFQFEVIDAGPLFDEVVGPYGRRLPERARGAQNAVYYWPR